MVESAVRHVNLKQSPIINQKNLWRALKNSLKASFYAVLFLLISSLFFPLISNLVKGQTLGALFEYSITIFFILSIMCALTSGTLLQVPLSFAKTLTLMGFTILAYENRILTIGYEQAATSLHVTFSIDIGTLLMFMLLLDVVLLAKEVVQLLSSIHKRVV
jgi:hypothetical protein